MGIVLGFTTASLLMQSSTKEFYTDGSILAGVISDPHVGGDLENAAGPEKDIGYFN